MDLPEEGVVFHAIPPKHFCCARTAGEHETHAGFALIEFSGADFDDEPVAAVSDLDNPRPCEPINPQSGMSIILLVK